MRQMKPTIKQQKRYNIFNECVNVLLFDIIFLMNASMFYYFDML